MIKSISGEFIFNKIEYILKSDVSTQFIANHRKTVDSNTLSQLHLSRRHGLKEEHKREIVRKVGT